MLPRNPAEVGHRGAHRRICRDCRTLRVPQVLLPTLPMLVLLPLRTGQSLVLPINLFPNGARVLQIQNWFHRKSRGRQCKDRQARNFDFLQLMLNAYSQATDTAPMIERNFESAL